MEKKQLEVLLAEDFEINRLIASKLLKSFDCNLEIAENGIQAVDKAILKVFDLIFMDVQMPLLSGIEASEKIMNYYGKTANLPVIIAVTSHSGGEISKECFAAGMRDFITKPFDRKQLEDIFKKWTKLPPENYN